MTTIALLHSPLVGPFTWSLVAVELRRRGWPVIVPNLHGPVIEEQRPFYQQHAEDVANALNDLAIGEEVILVAHSGAGPLLPAIGQSRRRPVGGYLFVDAGIARDGQSRLDMMAEEVPELADELGAHLRSGQRWPQWTDGDLADLIPQARRRQKLLAELTPQPLAYFAEPIPVFSAWPDAPCAYLRLSAAYDYSAAEARRRGWPVGHLKGGHFHMLVAETAVTRAILDLLTQRPAF